MFYKELILIQLVLICVRSTLGQLSSSSSSTHSSIETVLDLKTKINRLVLNEHSQHSSNRIDLYVASTNRLYKINDLNTKFQIEFNLTTGPKLHKQQCAVINPVFSNQCINYLCDDEEEGEYDQHGLKKSSARLIDNDNRLLLIDHGAQHLIECGSIDYGGCRLRSLTDLSVIGCNYSAPVIPFESAQGVLVRSSLYLMVSIEYDPLEERYDRTDFPLFSVRNLGTTTSSTIGNNEGAFVNLINTQRLFQSKYLIESMNYDPTIYTPDFHFKIVHSFKHNGFIYFLYTITNKILPDSCNSRLETENGSNAVEFESMKNNQTLNNRIVTRLLRICDSKSTSSNNGETKEQGVNQETIDQFTSLYTNGGANLAALTETVLDCDDPISGSKYHVLNSAHFHEMSGEAADDSILLLTFNNSNSKSAVCKIRIVEIDAHFMQMLHKCLDGDNDYGELVSPYSNRNSWKTPCRCSTLTDTVKKSPHLFFNSYFPSNIKPDNKKLFCHNDLFSYMNSRKTLSLKSIQMDSNDDSSNTSPMFTSISSLKIDNRENKRNMVLVLANSNAQLKMFNYNVESNLAQQYDQIDLVLDNSMKYSRDSASKITLNMPNKDEKYLYATYDKYLYKINLKHCDQYKTCDECTNGRSISPNPFCGWCVYEQKCALENECKITFLNSGSPQKCPSIENTNPTSFFNPLFEPKQDNFQFKLNLDLIKSAEINYFCDISLFNSSLNQVKAQVLNRTTLECDLNRLKSAFDQISINKKIQNVSLSIKSQTNNQEKMTLIANADLYAFNCTHFGDCSQCLNKNLMGNCVWCAKNSKCIFSSSLNTRDSQCPNEIDFYSRGHVGTDLCTSFSLHDSQTKIDIAYSADSNLGQLSKLSLKNAKQYQKKFICLFTRTKFIDKNATKFTKTNFIWSNNRTKFDCLYSPYNDIEQIDPHIPLQTIYMSVWWSAHENSAQLSDFYQVKLRRTQKIHQILNHLGEKIEIEEEEEDDLQDENLSLNSGEELGAESNLNNFIEINIINCKVKASSCGECMDENLLKLGCGWCKSSAKCTMQKDCPNISKSIYSDSFMNWLSDLDESSPFSYCPNPLITKMTPSCAPKQLSTHGAQITLYGQNLGRSRNDLRVRLVPLSVENGNKLYPELNCDILNYTKASAIVCKAEQLKSSFLDQTNELSVYVETNTNSINQIYSTFNQSNQLIFKYVVPEVISIEPKRGIKSGGTILRLIGRHLSCSTNFAIRLPAINSECTILNMTTLHRNQLSFNIEESLAFSASELLDLIYCQMPPIKDTTRQNNSPLISTNIELRMDEYGEILDETKFKFDYLDDPLIEKIEPERTIASGGILLTIKGKNFNNLQTVHLILSSQPILSQMQRSLSNLFRTECKISAKNLLECPMPQIRDERLKRNHVEYFLYVEFNNLGSRFLSKYNEKAHKILVFADPKFDENQLFSDTTPIILIRGEHLLQAVSQMDYKVLVGVENNYLECNVTSITSSMIACLLPDLNKLRSNENYIQINRLRSKRDFGLSSFQVIVQIGKNVFKHIGTLRVEKNESYLSSKYYDVFEIKFIIIAACSISFFLFITMISCFVVLKRRQKKQIRQLKRMQSEFENLEMRVARECKEAFTELQMDIGELVANTLNQTGAPFNDFETYCIKILFPNLSEQEKFSLKNAAGLNLPCNENMKNGVSMLNHLLLNKKFLLNFIHTLESDTQNFTLQDRVNLASLLSICLYDKFDYFTDILMALLSELIEKTCTSKNSPKVLFRRNESVAEKMLTNWFAFLLYDFICDCAGTPLYILFLSIKQQIYKGPVDAITCEARYSLSEDKLIRQSIDYEPITIRVHLHDSSNDSLAHEPIFVKVLNCDTITQAKEKILDAYFKGYPFTKRPHVDELDLVYAPADWMASKNGKLTLYDEDRTTKIDNENLKKLNTLSHYKISSGSLLYLVPRQTCLLITHNLHAEHSENMTLLSKSSKSSSSPPTYSKLSPNSSSDNSQIVGNGAGVYSIMNGSTVGLTEAAFNHMHNRNYSSYFNTFSKHDTLAKQSHANFSSSQKMKKYHLIKPNTSNGDSYFTLNPKSSSEELTAKLVSEVYLTRLLATKGGMQSFVDDFFESVFSTAHGSNVLPFAIKYLFDFLDEQAQAHGITDPDVVYTWKSNALPLRFWVNIIKNPDFVFDIHKSNIVDASLSVIASTFMDSCSQSRLDLNKESPSGKLLFYKEVHKYRKWVESYYSEIRQMASISEQELSEMLGQESRKSIGMFNRSNALAKLYTDYIKKHRSGIENFLNESSLSDAHTQSISKHLNYRLQQVIYLMDAIDV